MSVGFIMLVHTALDRAAQVARHLASAGSPVVIHVDRRVSDRECQRLRAILRGFDQVHFCDRYRCEWGTWSIVKATQSAAELMLRDFPDARQVFLTSGSCMPLRPLPELIGYLDQHPDTDFIESVTTSEVPWALGGLEEERFTLYFPFSWKRRRWLFDRFVAIQRALRIRRRPPPGLVPHLGSQWWCLTRRTLERILNDPNRRSVERYFKTLWIPDEAFFQSLVRVHSDTIESRSLTLSKFDFQGRPHIFYDDHLELLRRSDCFFARKVWPRADRLYQSFLSNDPRVTKNAEPNPGKIDRLFSKAVDRRVNGRDGLVMQSRFPRDPDAVAPTAWPYSVFQGYAQVFENFEHWLTRAGGSPVHGRLMHPERVEFAQGAADFKGNLSGTVALRDYDPEAFLRNLVWNTRGERQYFQYGPEDLIQPWEMMARDVNAQISVISGAWAVGLNRSELPFEDQKRLAAAFQRRERAQLEILRCPWTKARVRIHTLADYLINPIEPLQSILDEAKPTGAQFMGERPRLANMDGLAEFLQRLRNVGIQPYLVGNIQNTANARAPANDRARRQMVR